MILRPNTRHAGSVITVLLALAASAVTPARAQLHLAWNGCSGDSAAVSNQVFSCGSPEAVHRLVGSFSLPSPQSRVVTLDATLDFEFPAGGGIPTFWRFDTDACNQFGLMLSDARPHKGCAGSSNTLCGPHGAACDALITAYGPAYLGPDRGRLLLAIVRRSDDPVSLPAAPVRHFAFELVFGTDLSAGEAVCDGCATPVSIRWTRASLHGVDAGGESGRQVGQLLCDIPGGQPVATVNGATPAACDTSLAMPRPGE